MGAELRANPYARFMCDTLHQRVVELQEAESGSGHWASMKHELLLAKATLAEVVQFYAAMLLLPETQPARLASIMDAGRVLRQAVDEVASLAGKAAKIEADLRGKHDPSITLAFVQQVTRVMDHRLREAEERGELHDAELIIEAITRAVDSEVMVPIGASPVMGQAGGAALKPTGSTPATVDGQVRAMIETVPLAG